MGIMTTDKEEINYQAFMNELNEELLLQEVESIDKITTDNKLIFFINFLNINFVT